jgi:hypothetical protein
VVTAAVTNTLGFTAAGFYDPLTAPHLERTLGTSAKKVSAVTQRQSLRDWPHSVKPRSRVESDR